MKKLSDREVQPVGRRFSQVYLTRPDLLSDSQRMRRRLGSLVGQFGIQQSLRSVLQSQLGIPLQSVGSATADYWPPVFAKFELRDVLDAVTICHSCLTNDRQQENYRKAVEQILLDEQVSYRLDEKAGVHLKIDIEFARARAATIQALQAAGRVGVSEIFDAAYTALDRVPPDGKTAIRETFHAAENLFRIIFSNAQQLNASEVDKYLGPAIDRIFSEQKPAISVAKKTLTSFKAWIDGAHFYRHEPGSEEPTQPPFDLSVLFVSQGGAFIRWLAVLEKKITPKK